VWVHIRAIWGRDTPEGSTAILVAASRPPLQQPRERVILRQLLPTLSPLLWAQFWIAVPLFIISEANLGALGLSVSEPLPSWGNLLAELQYLPSIANQPTILAPAILLCTTVCCILLLTQREVKGI